jgi:peptide/nickel transport system permease protein
MIAQARNYMYQAPWGIILPVMAMFVTVLGFNLLGEGLRVTLDPRLRRRNF